METHRASDAADLAVSRKPAQRKFGFSSTFESLQVRDYRFYFISSLAFMACMNIQMVASGWFTYKLTGSSALLGITLLANAIPGITFSFFGGTLADKFPKKLIVMLGFLASGLTVLPIAVAASFDSVTWQLMAASSFMQGTVQALMMPSRQAMITEIVGRDKLMNAIALNSAGMNVNQIGAPAIAGFMLAVGGIDGVYYLLTGLYVLAMLLAIPITRNTSTSYASDSEQNQKRSVFGDIKEGLVYVVENKTLLTILLLTFFTVVLSMPFRMLLPIFTEDVLKVGPERLGILYSVSGVGALVGSLFIASIGEQRRGMLFLHTGLITGVTIFAFSLSHSYTISLVIMVISGVGQAGRMALSNTLLQSYSDDEHMGRVMSLFMMQWGVVTLGTFVVSVAAQYVGVQIAVGATGVMLVGMTLYYYVFSKRVRELN